MYFVISFWEEIIKNYQSNVFPISGHTSMKMENITLKEDKIENNCFERKEIPFAEVVEFRRENFGISDLYKEDQKGSYNLPK